MTHPVAVHERKNSTYKCSDCEYTSKQKHSVLRHQRAKHNEQLETTTFQCFGCDFETDDKDELGAKYSEFFPLIPSKREKNILVLLNLYIFEGRAFTFQFLKDEIHNYVKKTDATHCKYIRPDYDGTLAIHSSTIVLRTTSVLHTTMND